MSDIENKVVDNYLEHTQHNSYDEKCSECFKEQEEEEWEEEILCSVCNDSGTIEQGFWNDNNELQITSSKTCECSRD